MVKIIAVFGNDYAIELAEKRLAEQGFQFKRELPIKLIIDVKNKREMEIVKQIIISSYGYVEPIENIKSKISSALLKAVKYIIMPKKED